MASPKSRSRMSAARWMMVAALLIGLDQLSKLIIVNSHALGQQSVLTSWFNVVRVHNTGAAFSFLSDAGGWQRWFFTALGLGAAVFMLWMMHTNRTQQRLLLALALILSGAIGNVIDRIAYGHVIDFLLFYWQNWYYPAFNVADSCITLGAILLILDEILRLRGRHARAA